MAQAAASDRSDAGPEPDAPSLVARLLAEFVGTAFLLAAVVGSGIMAQQLSDDVGLQLLENAFATAGVLVALLGEALAHYGAPLLGVDTIAGSGPQGLGLTAIGLASHRRVRARAHASEDRAAARPCRTQGLDPDRMGRHG